MPPFHLVKIKIQLVLHFSLPTFYRPYIALYCSHFSFGQSIDDNLQFWPPSTCRSCELTFCGYTQLRVCDDISFKQKRKTGPDWFNQSSVIRVACFYRSFVRLNLFIIYFNWNLNALLCSARRLRNLCMHATKWYRVSCILHPLSHQFEYFLRLSILLFGIYKSLIVVERLHIDYNWLNFMFHHSFHFPIIYASVAHCLNVAHCFGFTYSLRDLMQPPERSSPIWLRLLRILDVTQVPIWKKSIFAS